MLLAVPVERGDGNEHRALGPRLVGGIVQAGDEVRVLGDVDEAGAAPDLQAAAVRVVDQDEGDTVVGPAVADAQLLAVAAEVGIGPRPLLPPLEEAAPAAAPLTHGPTRLPDGPPSSTGHVTTQPGVRRRRACR